MGNVDKMNGQAVCSWELKVTTREVNIAIDNAAVCDVAVVTTRMELNCS